MPVSAGASTLREFLLGHGDAPAAATLREADVAAYAYTALRNDHPLRPEVRGDYLASLARHHRMTAELPPLLLAWQEAGVEALIFKGFHLAEFVYPVPGARFHGDIDILIPTESEAVALRVAREQGWDEGMNSRVDGRPHFHGVATLRAPGGATQIDLHRSLLHNNYPMARAPRRVSDAVWADAVRRTWRGVGVRLPRPVDALLILALQRCWGDRWRLKSHDPLDMRLLAAGDPEWRVRLASRARELGAARTVAIFLEQCDPERGRLELNRSSRWIVVRRTAAIVRERPLLLAGRWVHRMRRAPGCALDVARTMKWVLRARRAVARGGAISGIVNALSPSAPAPGRTSPTRRRRTARGIRWSTRLLRPLRDDTCLVRSLALYAALRHQGWPVEFVSGVRRAPAGVIGHAWVELDGRLLSDLQDPIARRFTANFRSGGAEPAREPDADRVRTANRPGRPPGAVHHQG